MIHHSDGLFAVIREHKEVHPFACIQIFDCPGLLKELKALVTSNNESDRIYMPTGIPPHVEAVQQWNKLVDFILKLEREEKKAHLEHIVAIIGDKMEEIVIQNGHVAIIFFEKPRNKNKILITPQQYHVKTNINLT